MSKPMWRPSQERVENTNMYRFMHYVNQNFGKNFKTYGDLYEWSVEDIPEFWRAMWDFGEVFASVPYGRIVDDVAKMPGAKWFEGAPLELCREFASP